MPNKICLNMIIKESNHQLVIDCIESVKKNIDYIVIDDTGSPEPALRELKKYLSSLSAGKSANTEAKERNIPSSIRSVKWKNFGANRSMAIEHAERKLFSPLADADEWRKRDNWYLMFMDADNIPVDIPLIDRNILDKDGYNIAMRMGNTEYSYVYLVKIAPRKTWRWISPLHEYVTTTGWTPVMGLLPGHIISGRSGDRSKNPLKYLDDALVFEHLLIKFPTEARYWYYLGQSYRDCGRYEQALTAYAKHTTFTEDAAESRYTSFFAAGMISEILKKQDYVDFFWKALTVSPGRLESIFQICLSFFRKDMFATALMIGKPYLGTKTSAIANVLFTDHDVYNWQFDNIMAVSAIKSGNLKLGKELSLKVANCPLSPPAVKQSSLNNLEQILPVLAQMEQAEKTK